MIKPRLVNTPGHDLPTPPSRLSVHWKFVVLSSLFFIVATLVFIATFSIQRINDHKAEQATAASAFISQLTTIVENTGEQGLDQMVNSFLGTLVGVRVFSCINLSIESMNRIYAWPYQNCQSFQDREAPSLQFTSFRKNDPPAKFYVNATLDDSAPIQKFSTEAMHIAVSGLVMGLFTLFAVNFAFNRAVRQPLKNLLEELLEALAGSGEESSRNSEIDSRISKFSSTYDAMLERAKELRRKEAFWRAVTDSSFDCIISADRGGRIIDFNAAAEKTFGYERDKILGLQISDLLVPERHQRAHNEGWTRYLKTGEPQLIGKTLKTEALKADGTEIRVEISIAKISLEGEQYFTAYLRDVTEAKRTLDALEESEAMLTQSAEMAHLGYAIWDDILDKDVMVSEELARIHGLTRDEYQETVSSMGKYLEFVVPDDREKYQDYENQFTADDSGKAAGVEYRIMRPDGEFRHLHQRSQYVPVSSGRPTQSIVVVQDITEQKQVEFRLKKSREALEESEAMLTQSVAMANLGHAVWEYGGENYAYVSEEWARIFGYTRDEFLAKFTDVEKDNSLIHPDDFERYRAYYEDEDPDDLEPDIEYRIVTRNNEIRHLLQSHKYLFNEAGERTRSLVTIQDITDRIERENELNEARNAAEQASVAKSSFLAMMSHEIRTPLNAVLGALGLIDSKDLDPSLRKFLNVGRKGAESLLHIVNDILDFSKMEAGKLQLEPSLFNLQKTIDDVVQVLEHRASEKKISLTGALDLDVPEFLIGDASRIRQVLLNLCSNAVRFTDIGGVKINISKSTQPDNIGHIHFQVEDSGRGVPLEDQKHLFEEFWGTSATTLDNVGSTGLGLSICKQLVEMMEGSIGFVSEPGRGSTFWFELSLERPSKEALRIEKSIYKKFTQIDPYINLPILRGRVLLAEDNPANQLIEQVVLERMGLQVDVVANGHEVLSALRSVPYNVVLMDINMPEMGGVEATVAIRNLPGELASTPIIAMTALAMPGDRERFLAQGMDGYISKPINREELHGCIARVLEGLELLPASAVNSRDDSAADSAAEIIDANILSALRVNVGAECLPQIIDAYLLEGSVRVDAITAAAASGDCELVAKEAHPLKSSSANMGAIRLAKLAGSLEHAGLEHDLEKIGLDVLDLPSLSEQTREELLRFHEGEQSNPDNCC